MVRDIYMLELGCIDYCSIRTWCGVTLLWRFYNYLGENKGRIRNASVSVVKFQPNIDIGVF